MKTTLSFSALTEPWKFASINPHIEKMPLEPIRSSEYKLFHFNRYITSADAVKEMEAGGWVPATLSELLSWKDGNKSDWVITLGQSARVGGDRAVPVLWPRDGRWHLGLDPWGGGWPSSYRFLAIKTTSDSKRVEDSALDDSFVERFWAQVDKTENCWNWTGAKHEQGYGLIKKGDTSVRAHRNMMYTYKTSSTLKDAFPDIPKDWGTFL